MFWTVTKSSKNKFFFYDCALNTSTLNGTHTHAYKLEESHLKLSWESAHIQHLSCIWCLFEFPTACLACLLVSAATFQLIPSVFLESVRMWVCTHTRFGSSIRFTFAHKHIIIRCWLDIYALWWWYRYIYPSAAGIHYEVASLLISLPLFSSVRIIRLTVESWKAWNSSVDRLS